MHVCLLQGKTRKNSHQWKYTEDGFGLVSGLMTSIRLVSIIFKELLYLVSYFRKVRREGFEKKFSFVLEQMK